LFVRKAEVAHGQRAAAGLAARLDERHRCRVGHGMDRPSWKGIQGGFSRADPSTAPLWNIPSEFPEGPRQFPQAIDRDYQRL
jgi:hypothetical protein